jgi:2-C-methyl-D-erythritol 4-phosphate cytidylyltransferase
MNIALIIAGGSGKRMHQQVPKQFINIYDKPILLYTMECFQSHPDIEAIEIVLLKGWQEILLSYAKQFNITKLKWIIEGGETGQESIRNGIFNLYKKCNDRDIVLIHDGIRPLIDKEVISNCIAVCKEYGNAISALPYNEQIFKTEDGLTTHEYIPRETLRRVQTPQAYFFKKIYTSYKKAFKEKIGIFGSSYTNTMMAELGETLYFSAGSEKNIKITTPDDIELFKAFLNIKAK